MYRGSPLRSTLNTGYIKLWACVKYVPRAAQNREKHAFRCSRKILCARGYVMDEGTTTTTTTFFSLSFLLNRPRHSPSNHVLHARAWCLRAGHRTQNLPGWIRTAQNWYFAKGRTTKPQTPIFRNGICRILVYLRGNVSSTSSNLEALALFETVSISNSASTNSSNTKKNMSSFCVMT